MERKDTQNQQYPKPWGETWSFNGNSGIRVIVTNVDELIASGVFVSPVAVEGNWGKDAAQKYVDAERARRMANRNNGF